MAAAFISFSLVLKLLLAPRAFQLPSWPLQALRLTRLVAVLFPNFAPKQCQDRGSADSWDCCNSTEDCKNCGYHAGTSHVRNDDNGVAF